MTHPTVVVTAPSRLHFGLLSFGQPDQREFGGVGVMLSQPELQIRLTRADRFEAVGVDSQRAADFARAWGEYHGAFLDADELSCRIEIVRAPRPHTGLGTGTQLGLAIAAGLCRLFSMRLPSIAELARSVGRGKRSAIGSFGFEQGGLLVESGRLASDKFSRLVKRVELPDEWRFVLACPTDISGLSGEQEMRAFANLPPVPHETTAQLCQEILLHLLPAAMNADFFAFGCSLYRYGHTAGLCFSELQHGAFATEKTARIVSVLRALGIEGVGQSSWGPTVFALVQDQAAAEMLRSLLRSEFNDELDLQIAAPSKIGAVVKVHE